MQTKLLLRSLILSICCLIGSPTLFAQVTTAALSGTVLDQAGEGLIGATVLARHEPSGTQYGVQTRDGGLFTIPNMRVGGPYTVKVSYVGMKEQQISGVSLNLNTRANLSFKMEDASTIFGPVLITAERNDILGSDRTGAETNIGNEVIQALPSISRSQADYTRLNPMAAEGGSFAGRNDQFNSYSLDGAIFNNPFGLDAATPGGQADAQPVSLDAIDQVSVAIAPYDVAQAGFTGAAVNAVTKSGTNTFHGTVFGFFRNKNMYGANVAGTEVTRGDLSQTQAGASIGGSIIKDKLFFFANYEQSRASDLGSYFAANRGTGAANESRVLASDLELVSQLLKTRYGYETGAYEGFKHNTVSDKALLKFDYNISNNHKLSATFTWLEASKDKPAHPSAIGPRGPSLTTLQFQNAGYRINNNILGGIIELKSTFGGRVSNKFQTGLTQFNDYRDPFSSPFPVLNIGKGGQRYIIAGHEPFSISNKLDQMVFQINDNVNIYLGKHTLTVGASLERFSFDNSFNLTGYGPRVFFGNIEMDSFQTVVERGDLDAEVAAAQATFDANKVGDHKFGNWALAETNLGQAAFYVQDEIAISKKFNLTLGLRADMPLYFNSVEKMQESIDRNGAYDPTIQYYNAEGTPIKLDSKVFPKQTPLFSPRISFNYDIKGNRSMILRGGSGLFTGRFPFVWIGNQVANPNFFFYCVTDPDFKFPQVWRTNLVYDLKIGNGWVGSIDLIYTKDQNASMVRNYGLIKPTGSINTPGDNRPYYQSADRGNTAYVFSNTNLGCSLNAGFQIEKAWKNGFFAKIGYNYLDAKDAASIDAEISSDAFDRNPANIANTNTAELAPSLYGNKHRALAAISKKFSYGKREQWSTLVSVFADRTQGSRYSYTYAGDINNDGSGLNDLMFIPTDAQIDAMTFAGDAAAQRTAFKAYIAQDDYLSPNRGKYTEKYGAISPAFSRVDIRLAQEFMFKNKNRIQFSADILNAGNMLNSKWGVRQYATYTGLAQPIAANTDLATGDVTYQFDTTQKSTFFNDFSLLSRWQMQFGLRYSF